MKTTDEMWQTVKGDPVYYAKVVRIARIAEVSIEDVVCVLEASYDVTTQMADERNALRDKYESSPGL